jgi:peptidoglycan/xylan/chitin deacetylase (PgdA/CDA1 family)
MRLLHDHGFEVIDLAEAVRRLASPLSQNERSIVLTFDDGFADFRANAWPILQTFRFHATVFLPTAFISASRTSFNGRRCLTWGEVRELHQQGVSFGTHTMTHPVLHGMRWPDIKRELADSRKALEDAVQQRVSSFAYPYAFPQEDRPFIRRFIGEVAETGYKQCVTTVIGRARSGASPMLLSRLPVNSCDDIAFLLSKLIGAYDWMREAQVLIRHTRRLRPWIFRSSL